MPSRDRADSVPGHERRTGLPVYAAVAAITLGVLAAYSGTFHVPFLFDDSTAIVTNPTLRHFGSAIFPPPDTTVSGRPVLNLSLAANYAAGGLSVAGYHAANLAVHLGSALLLFGIVRRTLARLNDGEAATAALFCALLWALHPLQTEAVTYVVQRAESLMALFYLATLYCFIAGSDLEAKGGRPWYGLSIACCFLGMGTKEVMVSAPLVVLLYDRTFGAGSFAAALRLRWRVYCGLASSWVLLAFLVMSTHGRAGTAGFGTRVTPQSYAITQLWAVAHYLRLVLWPDPLVFDYGRNLMLPGLWILPYSIAGALVVGATVWALFRRPAFGFMGFCFAAVLAPSSTFVPIASETIAEHRMYLALAPLSVLVVVAARRVLGRGFVPFGAAVSCALLGATFARNATYRSEMALWSDTVANRPMNERAHNNLGYVLSREPGKLDEAIAQYGEALRLSPDYAQAHLNLANALITVPGRLNDAIVQFEASLRLNPNQAEARYNLGRALVAIPGRMDDAIRQYEAALAIQPVYPEAHYNLGCALGAVGGRAPEAIAEYEAALAQDPRLMEAHFNLGCVLVAEEGRRKDAIVQFEEAIRLAPGYIPARLNLAMALNADGRPQEALADLDEVLRLEPGNGTARAMVARLAPDHP